MVFTHHLADHARAFHVSAVPDVVHFVHAEQHAPMHRLEAVAHIRQGATHDYAHRVVEVTLAHFVFDIDANDFFGQLSHQRILPELMPWGRRVGRCPAGSSGLPDSITSAPSKTLKKRCFLLTYAAVCGAQWRLVRKAGTSCPRGVR